MSWVAVAIGGSAVIGAVASSKASNKAAGAAQQSSDASIAENARQFDLVRSDTSQARALGSGAIEKLGRLYGINTTAPTDSGVDGGWTYDQATGSWSPSQQAQVSPAARAPDLSVFTQSPDYQFNLGEGQKAIDRSLVARGRGLSGAGVREGVRYASGLASTELNNYSNRLAALAGIGQTATGTSAQAGLVTAGNNSNAIMNAGNQRASAYLQNGQTISNSVNGLASNYLLMKYLGGGK